MKISPTGAKVVYGTWLSGTYGATPTGLVVDGQGNAVLAGFTESSDYPVTSEAFQTASFATAQISNAQRDFVLSGFPGPPTTGYVTKLNAAGNGLVFSTFVGGSGQDSITSLALDNEGNIDLAGFAQSQDFPGLTPIPDACRPSSLYPAPFITRLSADGSALTESQLAYGLGVKPLPGPLLAAFGGQGKGAMLVGTSLALLDLFAAPPSFACATDAADFAPLAQIAPGQLLTLFGSGIGSNPSVISQPQNGQLPTTAGKTTVTFNSVPAPILYSSLNQINVQVPYEIASQSTVQMEISGGASGGRRAFTVIQNEPSSFVYPGYTTCQGTITTLQLPVALNADGSLNGCNNPADVGSTVTLFVNGLGLAGSEPLTGAIAPSPATPLNLPVSVSGDAVLVSAESDPGAVNGAWIVQIKVTRAERQTPLVALAYFTLSIGGVTVRDSLVLWTRPSQ